MEVVKYPAKESWASIIARPDNDNETVFATVRDILQEVKSDGDLAIKKFSEKFDKVTIDALSVSQEEIKEAINLVSDELKSAIKLAASNIEKFHAAQVFESRKVETTKGVVCWQKSSPIEKVGLYVPGGTAPLFSTVLMLAIPANIAGCKEIALCTPPNKAGKIHPAILYAANLVGVTKIFKIGGVQAIAAMAYGTETVPKVYKIFGPGNQFVTAAKQLVSLKEVAIDMPAGPSEVEVIADASADPAFIASDLLSQAEHGATSQVVLVTTSEAIVPLVLNEVEKQLDLLPRKELAAKAIDNSIVVVLRSMDEVIELTNLYAPEHLIVATDNYMAIADKIVNAGSIFLGHYTPESAGDYASGTNHTLPTNGFAKTYSGVNLDSYIKKITFQEISPEGLLNIGPSIEIMAANEELEAHKNAVTLRLKKINK